MGPENNMNLYDELVANGGAQDHQMILGVPVPTVFGHIDPNSPKLHVDGSNPRTSEYNTAKMTEKERRELLLNKFGVKELMRGIRQTRGLNDPIESTSNGIVINGNRRLVGSSFLHTENVRLGIEDPFTVIPIIVYSPMLTEEQCDTRKTHSNSDARQWPPLSNATHALRMFEKHGWSVEQIRDQTGWTLQNTRGYVEGAKLLRKYREIYPPAGEAVKSIWTPLFKTGANPKLLAFTQTNPDYWNWFCKMLRMRKFGDSRYFLRSIEVFEHVTAREMALENGMARAITWLDKQMGADDGPDTLEKHCTWISDWCKTLTTPQLVSLQKNSIKAEERRLMLTNMQLEVRKILEKVVLKSEVLKSKTAATSTSLFTS